MIIVTGGAGFIGSNLINALIEKKQKVFLCDYPGLVKKNYFNKYDQIKRIIPPDNLFEFISVNDVKVIYHLGSSSTDS